MGEFFSFAKWYLLQFCGFFLSFFWLKTLGFFFLAKVTEFVCHVLSSFLFLA
jgi:hypothetical protein